MELSDYIGKPCSNKTSFEFKPKNKTRISLTKLSKKLDNIEINSKILIITKIDDTTTSIFDDGKILVRGIKNEEQAKQIANKIVQKIS